MTQVVTELIDQYADWPEPVQTTTLVLGIATAAMLLFAGGAVGARAKFIELREVLKETNLTMGKTAFAGAAAGLALAGIITVVGLLMAKQAEARAVAESFADTIDATTGKLSTLARNKAIELLQEGGDFLSFNWQSAADAADKLGFGMDTLADAALKNQDAVDKLGPYYVALGGDMDALNRISQETGLSQVEVRFALEAMLNGVQRVNDGIDEGIRLKGQETEANKGTEATAQNATDAYFAEADSVEQLNNELADLIDRINSANGVAVDGITANADYLSALDGLAAQVQENGTSLNELTVAGSANAAAMGAIAEKARYAASAQFEQDLATMSADDAAKKWNATLQAQKQVFIDSAIAAGYNADEVKALADRIVQMPSEKEIALLVEKAKAQSDRKSVV